MSLEAGEPWRDRLLPLPAFLREAARLEARPSAEDIADAFRLTGHFLLRDVFATRGEPLPNSRQAFLAAAARRARRGNDGAPLAPSYDRLMCSSAAAQGCAKKHGEEP